MYVTILKKSKIKCLNVFCSYEFLGRLSSLFWTDQLLNKVNSVQEACAECFAVHLSIFEILQTTRKNKTKNIKMLNLLVKNWKLRVWSEFEFWGWYSLFHVFHVICKISNVNPKAFCASFLYWVDLIQQEWNPPTDPQHTQKKTPNDSLPPKWAPNKPLTQNSQQTSKKPS